MDRAGVQRSGLPPVKDRSQPKALRFVLGLFSFQDSRRKHFGEFLERFLTNGLRVVPS